MNEVSNGCTRKVRVDLQLDAPSGQGLNTEGPPGHRTRDRDVSAFIDGFSRAADPRGFLRLAGVPLYTKGGDGADLTLVRVETFAITDISQLAPNPDMNGDGCAAIPAKHVSARRTVSLIYYDGTRLVPLSLAEALSLTQEAD